MKSTEFYDRFSFFYPIIELFISRHKNRLMDEINSLSTGNLLEIGVGNGSQLNQYKNHTITAIDTSKKMLIKAKNKTKSKVNFMIMDGQKMTFEPERFDYVVLSHVITVVDDISKLISECERVLKSNGKIIILNHFTSDNLTRFVDKSLNSVSKIFHFKSFFEMKDLKFPSNLVLKKEIILGNFSYFRIVIIEKK